jgi:hypothetical protein
LERNRSNGGTSVIQNYSEQQNPVIGPDGQALGSSLKQPPLFQFTSRQKVGVPLKHFSGSHLRVSVLLWFLLSSQWSTRNGFDRSFPHGRRMAGVRIRIEATANGQIPGQVKLNH